MLSVPEEFLLLTLKDENGGFVDITTEHLRAGFVGAAIMELGMLGRIDSDPKRIWVSDPTPTGNPVLDMVLSRLATPGFDTSADRLLYQLVELGAEVRKQSLAQLCDKQILVETEGRILWLLKTRRYPVVDGREIREVKLRLLEVLLGDELPGPRDVCLMSLAESCGIIAQMVPPSELARSRDKIAKFARMELIGQNVRRYIELFEQALATATFGQG